MDVESGSAEGGNPWDWINRGEWPGSKWLEWVETQMLDLAGIRADQTELGPSWKEKLRKEWLWYKTQ